MTNFTPKHAMKAQSGSGGTSVPFLWPRRWMAMGGQGQAQAALPPGKITRYPLYRTMDRTRGWSRRVRNMSRPPRLICDTPCYRPYEFDEWYFQGTAMLPLQIQLSNDAQWLYVFHKHANFGWVESSTKFGDKVCWCVSCSKYCGLWPWGRLSL